MPNPVTPAAQTTPTRENIAAVMWDHIHVSEHEIPANLQGERRAEFIDAVKNLFIDTLADHSPPVVTRYMLGRTLDGSYDAYISLKPEANTVYTEVTKRTTGPALGLATNRATFHAMDLIDDKGRWKVKGDPAAIADNISKHVSKDYAFAVVHELAHVPDIVSRHGISGGNDYKEARTMDRLHLRVMEDIQQELSRKAGWREELTLTPEDKQRLNAKYREHISHFDDRRNDRFDDNKTFLMSRDKILPPTLDEYLVDMAKKHPEMGRIITESRAEMQAEATRPLANDFFSNMRRIIMGSEAPGVKHVDPTNIFVDVIQKQYKDFAGIEGDGQFVRALGNDLQKKVRNHVTELDKGGYSRNDRVSESFARMVDAQSVTLNPQKVPLRDLPNGRNPLAALLLPNLDDHVTNQSLPKVERMAEQLEQEIEWREQHIKKKQQEKLELETRRKETEPQRKAVTAKIEEMIADGKVVVNGSTRGVLGRLTADDIGDLAKMKKELAALGIDSAFRDSPSHGARTLNISLSRVSDELPELDVTRLGKKFTNFDAGAQRAHIEQLKKSVSQDLNELASKGRAAQGFVMEDGVVIRLAEADVANMPGLVERMEALGIDSKPRDSRSLGERVVDVKLFQLREQFPDIPFDDIKLRFSPKNAMPPSDQPEPEKPGRAPLAQPEPTPEQAAKHLMNRALLGNDDYKAVVAGVNSRGTFTFEGEQGAQKAAIFTETLRKAGINATLDASANKVDFPVYEAVKQLGMIRADFAPGVVEDNRNTARSYIDAVMRGDAKGVQEALNKGVYPDIADENGKGVLTIAREQGNGRIVSMIKGAIRYQESIQSDDQYRRERAQEKQAEGQQPKRQQPEPAPPKSEPKKEHHTPTGRKSDDQILLETYKEAIEKLSTLEPSENLKKKIEALQSKVDVLERKLQPPPEKHINAAQLTLEQEAQLQRNFEEGHEIIIKKGQFSQLDGTKGDSKPMSDPGSVLPKNQDVAFPLEAQAFRAPEAESSARPAANMPEMDGKFNRGYAIGGLLNRANDIKEGKASALDTAAVALDTVGLSSTAGGNAAGLLGNIAGIASQAQKGYEAGGSEEAAYQGGKAAANSVIAAEIMAPGATISQIGQLKDLPGAAKNFIPAASNTITNIRNGTTLASIGANLQNAKGGMTLANVKSAAGVGANMAGKMALVNSAIGVVSDTADYATGRKDYDYENVSGTAVDAALNLDPVKAVTGIAGLTKLVGVDTGIQNIDITTLTDTVGLTQSNGERIADIRNETIGIYKAEQERFKAGEIDPSHRQPYAGPQMTDYQHLSAVKYQLEKYLPDGKIDGHKVGSEFKDIDMSKQDNYLAYKGAMNRMMNEQEKIMIANSSMVPRWMRSGEGAEKYNDAESNVNLLKAAEKEFAMFEKKIVEARRAKEAFAGNIAKLDANKDGNLSTDELNLAKGGKPGEREVLDTKDLDKIKELIGKEEGDKLKHVLAANGVTFDGSIAVNAAPGQTPKGQQLAQKGQGPTVT